MKKKIIIANWKMSLGLKETGSLTSEILKGLKKIKNLQNLEIVLCPSFIALPMVKELVKNSSLPIFLGAQNVFWEEKGAYTGEVSVSMLKELGVNYIIVGHSERRDYLKEDDEMVHKKIRIVLDYNLIPILCIGETFEERQLGQKDYVIIKQLSTSLEGINFEKNDQLVIAYEPVWVIGSGQAVAPEEAEYTNQVIIQRLIDLFPMELVKNNFRIIYGGSVDSTNIKNFARRKIDGFLVGGASLEALEFLKIIELCSSI